MIPVNNKLIKVGVAACISLLCSHEAFSAPPDAGVLLDTVRPLPLQPPAKPSENMIIAPEESRPAMRDRPGLLVLINHVRFSGEKAFPEQVLQEVIAGKIGKELNFDDLTAISGLVTKYYRDHGYLVARAYIPEQPLSDNTVEIAVLEGLLGDVTVNYKTAGPKISDGQLKGFVNGEIPKGSAITVPRLERAMLLENELPNVTATATLVPGASVGTSDLVLEANQQGWFSRDTLDADNSGSRYSGVGRYGGSFNLASPAGLGDELSARILTSFDGFSYGRLSWTTPVGDNGLKVGVAGTYSNYSLGGPFEAAGLKGSSEVNSLFAVYPYIRTRFFNLYQTVTVESKSLFNVANSGDISNKRIHDIALGINGDDFDGWMGGGLSTFSVTLTGGSVDLSNNPTDASNDAATARIAGSYGKFSFQAMRQQQLAENWVLYGSVSGQLADKNLDSSESMVFGGPTAVRAYPVGEAPANEGLLATVELRYNTIAPHDLGSLQYQLFYDFGEVRLNHNTWAQYQSSGLPNSYNLQGVGLGINLYKENSYLMNAALATKIGNNPDPGTGGVDVDGRRMATRLWLQFARYW